MIILGAAFKNWPISQIWVRIGFSISSLKNSHLYWKKGGPFYSISFRAKCCWHLVLLQRSNDHMGMNLLHENLTLKIPRTVIILLGFFIALFTLFSIQFPKEDFNDIKIDLIWKIEEIQKWAKIDRKVANLEPAYWNV